MLRKRNCLPGLAVCLFTATSPLWVDAQNESPSTTDRPRLQVVEPVQEGLEPVFDEKYDHWPEQLKIAGRVIVDNGIRDLEPVKPLFRGLVDTKRIVCFVDSSMEKQAIPKWLGQLAADSDRITVAPFEQALDAGASAWSEAIEQADVICLYSPNRTPALESRWCDAAPGLCRLVARGGTVVVDAALAPWLGRQVGDLAGDGAAVPEGACLNLFPDCLVDCQFDDSESRRKQILGQLAASPRTVGIGLSDQTLLVLNGRKMMCYGEGPVVFLLPDGGGSKSRVEILKPLGESGKLVEGSLLDLTQWRLEAIQRTLEPFPLPGTEIPRVERGNLVIVGGGGMPDGLMAEMIELAGGVEDARVVYIPCSEADDVGERQQVVEMWKRMGVKHATWIHTKDRQAANSDEAILGPLRNATMLWFGGGRQWNFSDSYYGTKAHQLMKEVLQRGGVIGGSSAGASIQARYLARATPIGNTRIMAPGYERGGLGFISGVAIDQHFTQRGRHPDMTRLMDQYPQLLGIGIDETTAIIVNQSQAQVVGRGKVHFYDRRHPVAPGQPDYVALEAGGVFDLATRTVVVETPVD